MRADACADEEHKLYGRCEKVSAWIKKSYEAIPDIVVTSFISTPDLGVRSLKLSCPSLDGAKSLKDRPLTTQHGIVA